MEAIKMELAIKRGEWRTLRQKKLDIKERLLADGLDKKAIRKNAAYRELEKRQEHLSTVIKHIEKRLNRALALVREGQRTDSCDHGAH